VITDAIVEGMKARAASAPTPAAVEVAATESLEKEILESATPTPEA
jgi:hypothetical protein